jgi:hypothetical protein
LLYNIQSEFGRNGYEKHTTHQLAESPLTDSEKYKKEEVERGEIYTSGKSTYVHGVNFPVDSAVMDALTQLHNGNVNYVQIVT